MSTYFPLPLEHMETTQTLRNIVLLLNRRAPQTLKYVWGALLFLSIFHGNYYVAARIFFKGSVPGSIHYQAFTTICGIFLFAVEYGITAILNKKKIAEYRLRVRNRLPENENNQLTSPWKEYERYSGLLFRWVALGSFPVMSASMGANKHVPGWANPLISGVNGLVFVCMAYGVRNDNGFVDSLNAVLLGIVIQTHHGLAKAIAACFIPVTVRIFPDIWSQLVHWAKPAVVVNPNVGEGVEMGNVEDEPEPVVLSFGEWLRFHFIRMVVVFVYIVALFLVAASTALLCSTENCLKLKHFPTKFLMVTGLWMGNEP